MNHWHHTSKQQRGGCCQLLRSIHDTWRLAVLGVQLICFKVRVLVKGPIVWIYSSDDLKSKWFHAEMLSGWPLKMTWWSSWWTLCQCWASAICHHMLSSSQGREAWHILSSGQYLWPLTLDMANLIHLRFCSRLLSWRGLGVEWISHIRTKEYRVYLRCWSLSDQSLTSINNHENTKRQLQITEYLTYHLCNEIVNSDVMLMAWAFVQIKQACASNNLHWFCFPA